MNTLEKKIVKKVARYQGVKRHVPKHYNKLIKRMKEIEKERIDVLHILELGEDLEDGDFMNLGKILREIQKRRRKVKDELLYYKRLMSLLENKKRINTKVVKQVLGETTKEMTGRVYYLRVRTDLTEYIGGSIRCRAS